MLTCDRCRAALLDRQYGLLDPPDAAAVDAHLAACPACQAEQLAVERFGRLVAAAARTEFPDVRFVAPADAPTPAGYTTTNGRTARRSFWSLAPWVVAAGLLLALAVPTGSHLATTAREQSELTAATDRYSDLERRQADAARRHAQALADAQAAWQKAQADIHNAEATLSARFAEAQRELQSKQLSFVISGPATVQAGAPAEFRLETRDPAGRPTPATVTYRVKDRDDKVVYEEKAARSDGTLAVKLPPTLPLKPNSELSLEVVAERADGPKAELREQLKLAAPVYVTHLTTDKPLYQPGEVVRFRSLTLDRATLKPAEEPLAIHVVVRDPLGAETPIVAGSNQLAAADGKPVLGPDGKPVRGVAAGEWTYRPAAKGGEYTLAVKETNGRFPEERRKFLVNQYQPALLNKELEWGRKSFGPGDEVVANCKVTNASGPVAHQPVSAEAVVDGQRFTVPCGPTSSDGTVAVKFTLPKQIERGEGSLTVVFTDGGNHEPLTKPIPIALKKLSIDFYAEGGDLVAGAPNRVYFQARTTLGKPADLKGRVVDGTGRAVATAETLTDDAEPGINQGMGRFEFTPEVGQSYRLLIDQPVGTEGEYKLPDVQAEGVVLTALTEVSGDPDPIRVRVASPSVSRTLLVGAYARGRLLDHRRVTVAANQFADVELRPEAGVGGVTRVTAFEELPGDGPHRELRPRAERLVYRKPAAALTLTAEPDKPRYVPGDHVTLSLKAHDEKGQPAAAVAVVGVVNQSVVTMADEKTFRTMPTHFLLTSEVRRPEDLEHADVLLGTHPKAAAALDLLLGTQGWRRFAEQTTPPVPNKPDQDGDRILLGIAHSPRVETTSLELERLKVQEAIGPAVAAARSELTAATDRLSQAQADARHVEEQRRLQAELGEARAAVQSAQTRLSETLEARERTLRWALPAACGLFLAVAVAALVAGLWRGLRYYIAAGGALGLAAAAAVVLAVHVGGPAGAPQTALAERSAATTTRAPFAAPEGALGRDQEFFFGTKKEQLGDQPAGQGGREDRLLREQVAPAIAGAVEGLGAVAQPAGRGSATAPAAPAPVAAPAPAPAAGEPAQVYKFADGAEQKADNKPAAPKAARGLGAPAGRPLNRANLGVAKDAEPEAEKALKLRAVDRDEADRKQVADLAKKPALQPPPAAGLMAGAGGMPGGGPRGVEQNDARFMRRAAGGRLGGLGWAAPPPPPPFVVREYAHRHTAAPAGDRTDFAETVFWHPVLVLPKDGAKVSFDLSDDVTRYQVLVAAHTLDGRLGALKAEVEARKPFSVEPKLPVEVTAGDRIDVPVTLANDTDATRIVTVTAEPKNLALVNGSLDVPLTLGPRQRARQVFSLRPTVAEGKAELRLTGRSNPFGDDAVVRTVPVVPEGFPVVGSVSDVLAGAARHEVVLPQTWVPGTLKCQVSVYPSTLAELQKGLEALLAEPGGCFEQTSTTNYPNTLVLEYLKESDQANPEAMKRAKALLERGYAKLTAFEVPQANKREGFEWFGQAPAHEALTAYGLMQFRDMARVTDVDPQLLKRTRDYLLARRDGHGGFARNPQALDSFGRAPDDVTNAYIVWALTEGGKDDDVTKELNALAAQAKTSTDPYFLALVANALLNRGRADEAVAILKTLAGKLTKDGYLDGARTSITGSAGRTLQIETTALAVLGWLKADRPAEFTEAVRSAVGWIGRQRGGHGGFGSTQSTILALKALIAYTKANKKTPEAGELSLAIGGRVLGKLAFAAGVQDALTVAVPDPERQLKPGKNDVRVELTGKNSFPYTLTWSYQTLQPPSAEGCAVRLTTSLDRPELTEGQAAQLRVKLENVSGKGQGMAVAIIGLPAGLKLPDDFAQLKDLARPRENGTKPGRIGAFEVRGRELVLYWRDLAPDAAIDLSLDVRALVPGAYHGPASRAYLYYNPDAKHWTAPLAATIAAKE